MSTCRAGENMKLERQNFLFLHSKPEEENYRGLIELVASIGEREPNDEERGYIARMLVQA